MKNAAITRYVIYLTLLCASCMDNGLDEKLKGPSQRLPENIDRRRILATCTITGRVTTGDADGQIVGLPGVNITVKGTTEGTVTDADGYYTITFDCNIQSRLMFAFLGYATQEKVVGTMTILDVTMVLDEGWDGRVPGTQSEESVII